MNRQRTGRRVVSVLLALALLFGWLPAGVQPVQALSPNIVISQIYGGGGNTGATYTHDFIELFNRGDSPISLAGWSLQYTSATGTGNFGSTEALRTDLPAVTLAAGQYLLVQEAQGSGGTMPLPTPDFIDSSPIAMSGTGAKVALVNTTTPLGCNGNANVCTPEALATIVDLVGWGSANYFEGAAAPATTNSTAILRNENGCRETDNNADDFSTAAPAPRNTASPLSPCGGTVELPVTAVCGSELVLNQGTSATRSVTATDPDGTVVDIQITSITPSPASGNISLGSLVPAGSVGGTASAVISVDAAVAAGVYSVLITAANDLAIPQTGTCTLSVNVQALTILPIGVVQGSVSDTDNGATHASPYAGSPATIQGVIYEKTMARTSSGSSTFGFFIQNTAATADSDPNSSDGLFVFMNRFTSLIGGYVPQVGDEVIIRGNISEFFNMSQMSSASLISLVRSGVDVNAEIPAFEVNPPDLLTDALRYWERHEGMRAQVPAGSKLISGRDVFPSTADGEVWLMRGDHPLAQRADPYARRSFRDPHPLDNDPALFDDGNGYRIILGSMGLKAAANDNTVLLAPATTFDTINDAPTGGVYYGFNKYQIMVEQQIDLTDGVDPALNAPPQPFNRLQEYSLAPYNVENLYDYRDDPFDGCDFTGNSGCPGVNPPFDYVPASDAAYQTRLDEIAQQIVFDLHSPDILMVQEAEDQDICIVNSGAFECGPNNNADGKPDTLQELTVAILEAGGPAYDAAFDRSGADDRGIVAAFLYRSDRVELLPAAADHPVLGNAPTVDYRGAALPYNTDVQNPKSLNAVIPADVESATGRDGSNVFTRAPQVGLFRIWRDAIGSGTYLNLYAISNHFSSTPDRRVGQRTEQSAYNAAIADALEAAFPNARIAIGGDFNIYPRPDDPFTPDSPLYPSDQLGPLYDQGMHNLFDVLLAENPSSAYSYVFQGQTQTLDQIFVNDTLYAELVEARAAHVNADYAKDHEGDGPRGLSDHDPLVARFCRDVTPPTITATVTPNSLWPPNHKYVTVHANVSVSDDADSTPTLTLISVTSSEPDAFHGMGDQPIDIVILDDFTFKLRAERFSFPNGRFYIITYQAVDDCGNVSTIELIVTVPHDQGS